MTIHFWGVRGSIATPLIPQQIRAKITAALQRATPENVVSDEAREQFAASLPEWLFGTVGGNTPCVELTTAGQEKLIFDAGTGIRALGKWGTPPQNLHYNLLFSHLHWDHIQGLPFFTPLYDPAVSFDIYAPIGDIRERLSGQMQPPYYPVTFDALTKHITFHTVRPGEPFSVGGVTVNLTPMSHPGGSFAYSVEEDGRKFVYATDVELRASDFERTVERCAVFEGADAIVIDSQYTVEEAYQKQDWGHSAFCYAIDFAIAWQIKKLYLFHLEPAYDDEKLYSILQSARWYADYASRDGVEVALAVEGEEFQV